jgi:hypothetical protein
LAGKKLSDDYEYLMTDVATVQPFSASGRWRDSLGPAVNYNCIAYHDTEKIPSDKGDEVVSNLQIYFDGNVTINPKDKIIHNGETAPILKIELIKNDAGGIYSVCIKTTTDSNQAA